jgi:hypothetical protein
VSIPDPIAEIVTLLKDGTAVAALAGARVYGGQLPQAETGEQPRAAVVVSPAAGPGRAGVMKIRRNRVDTTCYGATLNQAWKLHLAVREALETMEPSLDHHLLTIQTVADGALGLDPVTQWPTCYATYIARSATEP